MIYKKPISEYPDKTNEENRYLDLSDSEWSIAHVCNGFYLCFWGDNDVNDTLCHKTKERLKKPRTHELLFVASTEFEVFYLIRGIIANFETDAIFEILNVGLQEKQKIEFDFMQRN